MYTKRKSVAIAVAIAMLASGLALAAPAAAHDLDPKDKTGGNKDDPNDVPLWSGDKPVYVGLGIGDHIVDCVDGKTLGQVTLDNPANGNVLIQQSLPEPKTDVCLGGAGQVLAENEDLSSTTPTVPSVPSQWQVWVTDWVLNTGTHRGGPGTPGPWDVTNSEVLPVAAFASMRIKVHQHDLSSSTRSCTDPGPSGGTQACVEQPDADVEKTKQVARFAVCGKGGTDSIPTDPFSKVTTSEDDHYIVEKTMFVDGPVFYTFDCLLSPGTVSFIASIYNTFRDIFNNSPVCTESFACLFDFPARAASCWANEPGGNADWSTEAKHQIAGLAIPGMGIIGTVGWNHNSIVTNEGCEENANSGSWIISGGGVLPDVEIEDFPASVASQNDNYASGVIPQPCGGGGGGGSPDKTESGSGGDGDGRSTCNVGGDTFLT